ncbi:LOW QUALITY PROTEIN: hypothetical protein V2J09_010385 [Rumex salicifolius]
MVMVCNSLLQNGDGIDYGVCFISAVPRYAQAESIFINTTKQGIVQAQHQEDKLFVDRKFYELVNLVTAFVPSETACFASSPGKTNRTAVCISLDVIVGFLLYRANLDDSCASFSKISLMKLFIILIALLEIPMVNLFENLEYILYVSVLFFAFFFFPSIPPSFGSFFSAFGFFSAAVDDADGTFSAGFFSAFGAIFAGEITQRYECDFDYRERLGSLVYIGMREGFDWMMRR